MQFWPQDGEVSDLEFTAEGRRVRMVTRNSVRLMMQTPVKIAPPIIHGQSITSITFSPDGLRIATAADDQTVQVWDAATSPCRRDVQLDDSIVRLAFARAATA